MGGRCWRRRFPAAGMDISPKEAHSRSLRRNEHIIPACMEKSSMRTEIRSWRTLMPTCRSRAEENLFRRRCIISCALTGLTECTRDICPAIPRRMAVSGCQNNMQSRSSTRLALALRLRFLAEPRRDAIWDNRNPHSCAAIDLQTHASARDLHRLHRLGGGKVTLVIYRCRRIAAKERRTPGAM